MSNTLRQRPGALNKLDAKSTPSLLEKLDARASAASHSHGSDDSAALLAALAGSKSRGSRITLVGLGANVGLTGIKGVAGVVLGSAALTADAVHSGSDLLADIVTLLSFRWARQEPSTRTLFPYGYGKFESMGSMLVSFLLIGTAFGIGIHSYHLLLSSLSSSSIDFSFLSVLPTLSEGVEEELTDPRAMVFAGASVLIKGYLYRITLKVAKEEHSNVLLANALHHRSDAAGSLVALGAIAGAYLGYPVLDPVGGLLVSAMILHSGVEVGLGAFKELVDQTADPSLPPRIHAVLLSLRDPSLPPLPAHVDADLHTPENPAPALVEARLPIQSIDSVKVFTSGPSRTIDLVLSLPSTLTLLELGAIEATIKKRMVGEFEGRVGEVRIIFRGV